MTTTAQSTTWTAADLGAAMVAHYTSTWPKGWRRRADGVEGPAFFRGGDNPSSFRIVETRGVAMDARRGFSYSARDYARAVAGADLASFMAQWGTGRTVEAAAPRSTPAPRPPSPVDGGALWDALGNSSAALQWLREVRGFPADAQRLVESGATFLEPGAVPAAAPRWVARFAAGEGACVAFPLRSARDNTIHAVNLRACGSGARRTVGKLRDEDGTPRGYGWAGAALRARTLLLCEGAVDTLLAEAIVHDADPGLVAVGAVSATEIVTWAAFLAAEGFGGRLVVVRHLDGIDEDGAGQLAADKAVVMLDQAEHFDWSRFAKALRGAGVDLVPHLRRGFDLGDALRAAGAALPFDTFRDAFLSTVSRPA